ncbi:uncharacterized protein SPSK_02356 [Sporothrix schenckii 1099-18]|uniref:Major facilitator superfamily (MFS) profile domain-containing protein n=2 Tax=Sporothrix schenckii TaxID=29908 RepID=U7PNA2_SPOS1|nr:uncharacterized protein SPSK_02356 [Sporothrix schenckii 1099-18]ERS97067.1 hypothetical protein HMPREF1624_06396 [Sporothrix schenckii ATCC 58251]KJR86267.1 hypothetical protein SPSK_02356 [Sporothrix schenckii 1099-18]
MAKEEVDAPVATAPEIETAPAPAPVHGVYIAEGTGKTAQNEGATSKEVHNAELFAAIQESNIPRWSKSSIHLYFCIFIAFCSSYANGYDGSIFSSILGMAQFQKDIPIGTDGSKVSVVTSLYNVGSIVTTPIAALISDRFGRRIGMLVGAIGIIIGSIVTATSGTMAQLTVGRFILGSGVQFMTVAAPAYAIEIAPPHWRGRCTGLYNCGWFAGAVPAACITYGTQFINSSYAWKVPLILQNLASVIVVFSVWFIPESPRFLFAKARDDEAIDFLVTYHGNGNRQSRLVLLEIEEIRESIRQDAVDKAKPWWDYSPFFTHNGRWRAAQAIMMGVFGQFSGNGLGYFNVQIYKLIGVDSQSQQLGYQILYQVVGAIGALTAVSLTDRMPRRPVLIYGTFGVACLLAINAGLTNAIANDQAAHGGVITNKNNARGALAFYFLFQTFYSFTYTPLQGVVPAEALDTTLRAKGLALYGFAVGAVGFINTYAGPIALANITYKYIYVFVGWDVVEAILWYFLCVEAQGRSLEELEWVYNQPNPVKASQKVDKVVLQADGTVSEKIVEHAE